MTPHAATFAVARPLVGLRTRLATTARDRAYLAQVLPKVAVSGYHETADGFLEAVADGVVTPVVFEADGKFRGMVLVALYRAGRRERSLYIAAFYGEPDATDEERDAAMDRLTAIARFNKCSRMTFNSTRKGWGRRMVRYGFRRSPYVSYERSVDDGR